MGRNTILQLVSCPLISSGKCSFRPFLAHFPRFGWEISTTGWSKGILRRLKAGGGAVENPFLPNEPQQTWVWNSRLVYFQPEIGVEARMAISMINVRLCDWYFMELSGLSISLFCRKLYWTDGDNISIANMDGSNRSLLFMNQKGPIGMKITPCYHILPYPYALWKRSRTWISRASLSFWLIDHL